MKGKEKTRKIYPTECRLSKKSIDKKAFLNEQCKEVEKNNKMGKNRDLFKKTGDIKGIFHARMSMIKDRNGKDLTEAEEIKTRWQECIQRTIQKRS